MAVNDRHLDLRQLHHFLCVAQHGGFTRASTELHLSQQALSSSISRLETHLEVRLFERQARRVTLTPAGEALRDGAVVLLAAAHALTRQVHYAATEIPRPFVVGHTPAVTAEEVHRLCAPVRQQIPHASLTAIQLFPDALEPAVLDGTVDVALRRGVSTPKHLAGAIIAYHRIRVAMLSTHRLAHRESVSLTDLRDEVVILWAPPSTSFYTDFIMNTCRRAGFEPRYVINRVQGTPPVTAVLDNDGVAFVTEPAGPALGGEVKVIDLNEAPQTPIQALWLPHTASPLRDLLTTKKGTNDSSEIGKVGLAT